MPTTKKKKPETPGADPQDTSVDTTENKTENFNESNNENNNGNGKVKPSVTRVVFENSRSYCKVFYRFVSPETGVIEGFKDIASAVCKTDDITQASGAFSLWHTEPVFNVRGEQETKKVKRKVKGVETEVDSKVFKKYSTHWVVGESALKRPEVVRMTDGKNYKFDYFPQLLLGALSMIPDSELKAMSTGKKTRTLRIDLITQSVTDAFKLRGLLDTIKGVTIRGTRYNITWSKAPLGHPENFGIALQAIKDRKPTQRYAATVDIGRGTFAVIKYDISNSVPAHCDVNLHSSGGIQKFLDTFMKVVGTALNEDASEGNDLDQLELVLRVAGWNNEQNKVSIDKEAYKTLVSSFQMALDAWLERTQAAVAIQTATKFGLDMPLYLCGGGMASEPIKQTVKALLVKNGVPENHLIDVPDPQYSGVKLTGQYYANSK